MFLSLFYQTVKFGYSAKSGPLFVANKRLTSTNNRQGKAKAHFDILAVADYAWITMKHIAIYCRVSSKRQDTRSQKADLKRWAAALSFTTFYWHGSVVAVEHGLEFGPAASKDKPSWLAITLAVLMTTETR
jgi:hypothetical protein